MEQGMLYWGREGEDLQVSPRPMVNINLVLDWLIFKLRHTLHSLDPGALAQGQIQVVYCLDAWLHRPGMRAVLTSIPRVMVSRTVPGPSLCHSPGSVGDFAVSPGVEQEKPGWGSQACRGSQENLERMRGSGRGGERAREGG